MKSIVDALTYEEPITITAADIDEAMYLSTEYNYMITEALNEPHLLRLAAHLKKLADAGMGPGNFGATFGQFYMQWDKISSSNVKEYEIVTTKEVQAARKVLTGTGFVITTDEDWNFTRILKNYGTQKLCVNISGDRLTTNRRWVYITATQAYKYIENSPHLIIINLNGVKDIYTSEIRSARANARTGMIPSSRDPYTNWKGETTYGHDYEEYCKKIAKENYQRYKEIIAANKAKRNTDYERINKMVKQCLDRMMAAIAKVQADPIKYADSLWAMSAIVDKVNGERVFTGNYTRERSGYSGENGVLKLFKDYTYVYTNVVAKKGSYTTKTLEGLEKEIEATIDTMGVYFAELGV